MVKFQLKVYKVVGAVGITYMLDRLLASVFFIFGDDHAAIEVSESVS